MKRIFLGSFLCVVLSLTACSGDDIKETVVSTEIETTQATTEIETTQATSYSVPKTTRSYDNSYKKKESNNSSEQGYGYDMNDPYYRKNDHNNDGKLTDEEFQDAMGDFLDDLEKALEE